MEQLEDIPENSHAIEPKATETILRTMTQELENLKQNLIVQLNEDVERLKAEKNRLSQEIDGLQVQRREQIEQQQQLVKQLAQVMATQLQEQLQQIVDNQLSNMSSSGEMLPPSLISASNENAYRLIASLDSTLRTAFNTLQQDLSSYQSALSQQLGHMHSLEQQGEVILESLVNRLSQQLQAEARKPPQPPQDTVVAPQQQPPRDTVVTSAPPPVPTPPRVEPPAAQPAPARQRRQQLSQVQLGFLLVLLSTIALSIHNVVVKVVLSPSNILGLYTLGGFIKPSLGNSLLILWIRMLVVLPLMAAGAMFLYPAVWRDVKQFFVSRDKRAIATVVGSGFFLFCSQVLIYIAIGDIGPGVAVTILFMYPLITVPLAWLFFGDRPTLVRLGVMLTILLGVVLAALPSMTSANNVSGFGTIAAGISGVAFALYLIFMQLGFKKLHPVPVSLVQFFTIFLLSSIILILPFDLKVKVLPNNQLGLAIGGIILGALTLFGYLLNNFGVRYMGAARASIIASSGPVMTALLAFLLVPGPQTALKSIQITGIVLVTLGVLALSFERMLFQNRAAKPAKS